MMLRTNLYRRFFACRFCQQHRRLASSSLSLSISLCGSFKAENSFTLSQAKWNMSKRHYVSIAACSAKSGDKNPSVISPLVSLQGHYLVRRGSTPTLTNILRKLRRAQNIHFRVFSTSKQAWRPESAMNIFDRKAKRIQRDRTALMEDYEIYDYLKDEIGFRLADRICDVKRVFDVAVELGCGRGYVSRHVNQEMVRTVFQCEMSHRLLVQSKTPVDVPTHRVISDEEFLPFKENSLDLVVSSLSLHWVNDLPGCFKQVFNALKSDGVFLGTMFGGDTLYQLRGALQLAETEREGGFAAHISPFTEIRDVGNLLNRAGFTMLTIDVDELNISYPTMYELMTDLKGMGENNCAWSRKLHLHRDTITAAAAIYKEMYGNDQGVPATFQILYFIGWKPGKTQVNVAERGSANVSFKDLDRLNELVKEVGQLGDTSDPKSAQEKLDQLAEELRKKGNNSDMDKK